MILLKNNDINNKNDKNSEFADLQLAKIERTNQLLGRVVASPRDWL